MSNTRITAIEPQSTVDVLAGTFYVTDGDNVEKAMDFYVHTCPEPNDFGEGAEEARSKRQDDLNEQYTDVAYKLMLTYKERVRYVRTTPDPFF